MSHEAQHPEPEQNRQPAPVIPEKQIYRWKDDGGALPPEPTPDPASERD